MMRSVLIALALTVLVASPVHAAKAPPPEVAVAAQSWLTTELGFDGRVMSELGPNGHLGPAFQLYRTDSSRIAQAASEAQLTTIFQPVGWTFLLMNGQDQPRGEVVYIQANGQWQRLWSAFGNPEIHNEILQSSKSMPEKAVSHGLERNRADVAILQFQNLKLLVITDGTKELAQPYGVYPNAKEKPWRKGDLHSPKETIERLKALAAPNGKPGAAGGTGGGAPAAPAAAVGWLWWGLGGLLAAGLTLAAIWRRKRHA